MAEYELIDPVDARHDVQSGSALLVCAYESEEKYLQNQLEDSISLQTLRKMETEIDKDREIIFYCS